MLETPELAWNESNPTRLRRWMLTALVVALYLGVGVFDHELWPPGEQATAGATWSMLHDGDYLVPKIDGMAYLEKPPLTYALSALACKLAGHPSAGLLRLPSALFGLFSLALVFWTCRRKFGETAAWAGTLVCATTYTFCEIAHRASTDSAATFAAIACFALFVRDLEVGPGRSGMDRRWRDDLGFCLALAASFYVKNFYTFLVVVPPVAVFLLVTRQIRRLLSIGLTTAAALLILVAPWCWALYERGGSEYLRVVFVDNTIGRYFPAGDTAGRALSCLNDAYRVHRDVSAWSLLADLPLITLPWTVLYAGALVRLFAGRRSGDFGRFLAIAFVTLLLAISLSASKVYEYLMPILFVAGAATASFCADVFAGRDRARPWMSWTLGGNVLLVLFLLVAAPLCAASWLGDRELLGLPIVNLIVFVAIARHFRGQASSSAFTLASLASIVGSATLALALAIPHIDAVRTWRPFFDAIERDVAGRELYTSFCDDRRLPAMNWYLDRPLTTLAAPEDAFPLLASARHVAVILPVDFYESQKSRFDAIPHRAVRAPSGRDLFVLVTNP
jgi:4-amino-4-deoxy-L-arabinose transferase-like glycosyltransferase